jgi:hypothetical protein
MILWAPLPGSAAKVTDRLELALIGCQHCRRKLSARYYRH